MFMFEELRKTNPGPQKTLNRLAHLWFTWRRKDIFEVPIYPASRKKAREVAKMMDHTNNQREIGLEAESAQRDR
ncbi:hypothetical protein MAR_010855, partial [Mya arenaria]